MRRFSDNYISHSAAENYTLDQGLRAYMLQVYNYMALGLGLTGAVAFFISTSPALFNLLVASPLLWVSVLGTVGIAFGFGFALERMSFSTAQMLFWIYASLMGITLSSIFILYTGESIARIFFITASTFGAMSLYGYTTKRDLTGLGAYFFMGIIGIFFASLINLFFQSTGFQFFLSIITVLLFTGLTAYDTQMIRQEYYAGGEHQDKKAIFGALRLYLDFLNIFISLLRLFGDRK